VSFFTELKRRNVLRVGIAYLVFAWLIVQVSELILSVFRAPDYVMQLIIFALAIGLLVALILSWVYEITTEGILRTSEVPPELSVSKLTGRKLDFAIIGVLAVAVVLFAIDRFFWRNDGFENPQEVLSIAVLPFSFSSAKIAPFYSELSTDIARELERHQEVRLASRDAIDALPADADFRQVAARLGVNFILSGVIELLDNNLNLSVSIFEADRNKIVYETTFTDTNLVQLNGVVADEVLNSLGFSKAKTEKRQVDPQAYEYYLRALQAFEAVSDQREEAIALLEKAIKIEPQFASAHAAQCRVFVSLYGTTSSLEDFRQAEQACFRAWTIDNRSPGVLFAMGELYVKTGQREKALDSLQAVLNVNPNHYGARLALIDSIRQDSPELAEVQYKHLIREHPGSPEVYRSFMSLMFVQGRYEEAAQYAEMAYRLLPSERNAANLSSTLLLSGQFDRAQRLLEELVAGGNRHNIIMNNLGASMTLNGDYSSAAEFYREALKEAPDDTSLQKNLADAVSELEGEDAARPIYETVIQLAEQHLTINPDHYMVMTDLIQAYAFVGDSQQFQFYMKKALEQHPDDPQLMHAIAVGALRLGDMETARQFAEKALDLGFPAAFLNADAELSALLNQQ